ncbi:MAG TPA: ATP-binding cassette domain-containing protein, partial [Gammaproteobacteria bacterium]|nr:ATP-binding cassette domain-containing protein [Gammaproteobacteria bacterium]
MTNNQPVIEVNGLKLKLGDTWVHNGINLKIYPGEILGIVGGSGSGKTTLLREILMLQPLSSGSIKVFGNELT